MRELDMSKRRVFISFDHDDTEKVNGFLGLRNIIDTFECYNHKLDYRIKSADVDYIKRVIREDYIKPASVTVILIGNKTAQSGWVQWEIEESIRQGKGMLGIQLKDCNGTTPEGLKTNSVGSWQPEKFGDWIEWAYQQRGV
jgi:hypothetical protein